MLFGKDTFSILSIGFKTILNVRQTECHQNQNAILRRLYLYRCEYHPTENRLFLL